MLKTVTTKLANFAGFISLGSAFILMLIMVTDVIGRSLFNKPLKGADDLSGLLMVLLVFLGIALTQVNKAHITVRLLTSLFSSQIREVLNCFMSFASLAFISVMTFQLGKRAWVLLLNPSKGLTATLYWPLGPFIFVSALGCGLLALVLIVDLFDSMEKLINMKRSNS